MTTISEDYVSFETAKLLKEKGFDEACWSWYHNGNHTHTGTSRYCNSELEKYDFSKATLAHVMKWLREVHNIVVEPFIREDTKYVWYIHRIEIKFNKKYLVFCWGSKNIKYERYEQACEAAIKYCLENLV